MSAAPPTGQTRPFDAAGAIWDRFWHSSGSTLSLGLFRIVFAIALFLEVSITRGKSLFAVEGGFHLPYPFVPAFVHPISEQALHLLQFMQYPLILLLALGVLMRPAIVGLLALQGYVFFSDTLNFRNHPYFFLLVLLLLLFSPADESVSLKSVLRLVRTRRFSPFSIDPLIGPVRPLTFQRMIMVQVCLVYFLAGLQKINPGFLHGAVLAQELGTASRQWAMLLTGLLGGETVSRLQTMLLSQEATVTAAMATLALEMALPFTLWFRNTRTPSLIVGILFHIAIAALLGIPTFSCAMVGSYLLFLEPETLPSLARKRFGHRGSGGENGGGSGLRGSLHRPKSNRNPAVRTITG